MTLQAVIGPQALKSFTKTLTCLSRYSDDVVIQATQDALILSATNAAKSAFFHVKLMSTYFDKFVLKPPAQPGMTFQTPPEAENVKGQLLVKSLLSILKHRTVEKTVDRCDLSIVEGGQGSADHNTSDVQDEDSLSSKLILRLHCKHGVVKTHRLLLFTPSVLVAPKIPEISPSRLTVGHHTLRDLLDHFPHLRGDPQLAWNFAANDVVLRSIETTRGRNREATHLATEFSLSADEFDAYMIDALPVRISFHLREFNATVTLAESLSVPLDMRFSFPGEPLIITFDADTTDAEYLAMISTTQKEDGGRANPLKRSRENDSADVGLVTKSLRAATSSQPAATPRPAPNARSTPNESVGNSDPPPLFLPGASQDGARPPPASQLSAADLALVRSSGLGIEHMDYEEFEAMMEADGEEVGMSTAVRGIPRRTSVTGEHIHDGMDLGEHMHDTAGPDDGLDMSMGASQEPAGKYGSRVFKPLFDD